MPDPQFEIREPEIEELLADIGRKLKAQMPPGWGFTLLICSYGEGGAMFYLSSVEREDMVKAMKEFLAKAEGSSRTQ